MSTIVEEKWNEILDFMQEEYGITRVSRQTWLDPLTIVSVNDMNDELVLCLDDAVYNNNISYIKAKYSTLLRTAIAEITDHFYNISFVSSSSLNQEKKKAINTQPVLDSNSPSTDTYQFLDPKYTFDSFVIGPNNQFAHAAALAVAESPGELYNPLFIYGGVGLGKTHLMHSIARFIIENNPDLKVVYVSSEKFTNDLIESIRSGSKTKMTSSEFRDKYRNADVLLIDDIQFIIGKESTQEEFFHTFNTLHEAKKQVIISSDKPPKDMATLEERLRSRFESGITADIQQPDYETRMAILKKKCEELNSASMSDEILDFIVTNIKSNIRELEGAVKQVNFFARMNRQTITLSLVEEALKDMISPDKHKVITVEDIVNIVAEHFGITPNDIYSHSRSRKISYPRHIAMYLSRKIISISTTDLGRLIGNRDHATVVNSLQRIEEDIANNENNINQVIDILVKKINPPSP